MKQANSVMAERVRHPVLGLDPGFRRNDDFEASGSKKKAHSCLNNIENRVMWVKTEAKSRYFIYKKVSPPFSTFSTPLSSKRTPKNLDRSTNSE